MDIYSKILSADLTLEECEFYHMQRGFIFPCGDGRILSIEEEEVLT